MTQRADLRTFQRHYVANTKLIYTECALRWRYEQNSCVCHLRLRSILKTRPDRWGEGAAVPGRLGTNHRGVARAAECRRRRGAGADTHTQKKTQVLSSTLKHPSILYKCKWVFKLLRVGQKAQKLSTTLALLQIANIYFIATIFIFIKWKSKCL